MISPQSILDMPTGPAPYDGTTVRDYLIELLHALWREGESFDAKRPFGDSNWEEPLFEALGNAGVVALDEDNCFIDEEEIERAERLIDSAITSLGWVYSPEPPPFAAKSYGGWDIKVEDIGPGALDAR